MLGRVFASMCLIFLQISIASGQNLTSFEEQTPDVKYSAEEVKLGRQFMRGAFRQMDFSGDPEIVTYVRQLGQRIVTGSRMSPGRFTFFVLNNPSLNAFAAPGGFITLHTGLFLHSETESQLASVVSHEIAHITQRHLPRMLERARQRSLPAAAAMIAGVLVGGQVGSAALVSANAAVAADQLRYNRDFEREADAVGLRFLVAGGFTAHAMPDFFQKLQRHGSLSSIKVPEYLRSHPLSVNRIAATEARAMSYPQEQEKDSLEFLLIRARAEALLDKQAGRTPQYAVVNTATTAAELAKIYKNATLATLNGEYQLAGDEIGRLLDHQRDNLFFLLARGQLAMAKNQFTEAGDHFQNAATLYPKNPAALQHLARARIANEQYTEAKKAIRKWMRLSPGDSSSWAALSRVEGKLGNIAAAFQARAEYFALRFDTRRAISELQEARGHVGNNYYLQSSIEARELELNDELKRYGGQEDLVR